MASASDIVPVDEIKDLLTCSMCSRTLNEPKTLSCFHSFCKVCLGELYRYFCSTFACKFIIIAHTVILYSCKLTVLIITVDYNSQYSKGLCSKRECLYWVELLLLFVNIIHYGTTCTGCIFISDYENVNVHEMMLWCTQVQNVLWCYSEYISTPGRLRN